MFGHNIILCKLSTYILIRRFGRRNPMLYRVLIVNIVFFSIFIFIFYRFRLSLCLVPFYIIYVIILSSFYHLYLVPTVILLLPSITPLQYYLPSSTSFAFFLKYIIVFMCLIYYFVVLFVYVDTL